VKTRTAVVVLVLLFVVAGGASLMLYPSLPMRVPTHWDLHGEVNGWSSRLVGALTLPTLVLALLVFMLAGDWLSPARFKVAGFRGTFNYLLVIVASLLVYIHGVALADALHPSRGHGRWLIGGMFVFFGWLGNLLGKTRRNFWIGIRTPWTLASDPVWIATHRLGGRVLMATGAIGATAVAVGAPMASGFLLLLAAICIPVFYSLYLSKKLENEP
jgi:uncharacterized membrane protein